MARPLPLVSLRGLSRFIGRMMYFYSVSGSGQAATGFASLPAEAAAQAGLRCSTPFRTAPSGRAFRILRAATALIAKVCHCEIGSATEAIFQLYLASDFFKLQHCAPNTINHRPDPRFF
jgi:hypothetical protein